MNSEQWKDRLAERMDLTLKLSHLTKNAVLNGKKINVLDVLLKIIGDKKLIGSTTQSGFICGNQSAVCFQDTPLYSLAQNIYYEQKLRKGKQDNKVRYLGWGLLFDKMTIFKKGGRPVIYDKTDEAKLYLHNTEWWRIVNYNLDDTDRIGDWTHEREWRVKGDFVFELNEATVLVPNNKVLKIFTKKYKDKFSSEPLDDLNGIISLGEIFY